MGHGIKDENDETNIFFVTTGYLVRLLAFKPEAFKNHTHIIIDEVHERSIDGDVLCYLVKQLLMNHDTIRVILMSATIHTELYSDYFSDVIDSYDGHITALSVGLKRFPIEIKYIEDIKNLPKEGNNSNVKIDILSKKIIETCKRIRGRGDPGLQFPKDQYFMVRYIIETYAVNEITSGNLLQNISSINLNSLEQMLHHLQHSTQEVKEDVVEEKQEEYQFKHPNWKDIMFTHYYQLVCKHLLRLFENSAESSSSSTSSFNNFHVNHFLLLLFYLF